MKQLESATSCAKTRKERVVTELMRTFGTVMSLGVNVNCGQVRGPAQITFGRSVDPVIALEHSITRMAVATEAESENQSDELK
jgi:CRISPR-associated protein Csd2